MPSPEHKEIEINKRVVAAWGLIVLGMLLIFHSPMSKEIGELLAGVFSGAVGVGILPIKSDKF